MSEKTVTVPQLCQKHYSLLIHQAKYKKTDPYMIVTFACNFSLFQAVIADPKVKEKVDKNITKIESFGCLACYKPDVFGEIVEAAKTHNISKVKAIGEKYLKINEMSMTVKTEVIE